MLPARGKSSKDRGWERRTVMRKKATKCRPLSLWPYWGIFEEVKPRYAEASMRTAKEAAQGEAVVSYAT